MHVFSSQLLSIKVAALMSCCPTKFKIMRFFTRTRQFYIFHLKLCVVLYEK